MSRRVLLAVAVCALTLISGCQTWQDKADAEALADCANFADALKRKICQTEVMTAAGDAERRLLAQQAEAAKEREDAKALREAYGLPEKAH